MGYPYYVLQFGPNYLDELKKRGTESHVYKDFQLIGLEIADILGDRKHKALYIKLAKEYGGSRLFKIAKAIQEKKDIKNRGAYFMKVFKESKTKSKE